MWDYNVVVGGPIAKDRLWFFGSFGIGVPRIRLPDLYYNATQREWFYTPDRTRQAVTTVTDKSIMARMTWQATPKNKFNCSTTISRIVRAIATSVRQRPRRRPSTPCHPNNVRRSRGSPLGQAGCSWRPGHNSCDELGDLSTARRSDPTPCPPLIKSAESQSVPHYRRAGPGGNGYGNHHNNIETYMASASYVPGRITQGRHSNRPWLA